MNDTEKLRLADLAGALLVSSTASDFVRSSSVIAEAAGRRLIGWNIWGQIEGEDGG